MSTFAKVWVRPEVYPIWAVIGAAGGLCTFFCSRSLMHNPDVRVIKADRSAGVLEDEKFYQEGEYFHNHAVRRFCKATKPEVFPGINAKLGGSA